MEPTGADVDAMLQTVDEVRRADMIALDTLIVERMRAAGVADRERELWEGVFWSGTFQQIIGYVRTEQERPKGPAVEWFLIGIAAQQKHVSLYVNAAVAGQYLVKKHAERLRGAKVGAAAVTIPTLAKVDPQALTDLIDEALATLS